MEENAALEREEKPGFYFLGGYLCVDFVNTRHAEDGRVVGDLLGGPRDLARWLREAGVLGPLEAEEMGERLGERGFRRAIRFREVLRSMVEGVAAGESVSREEVEEINGVLRARRGYTQVVRSGDGFEGRFVAEGGGEAGGISPVAQSAAELLAGGDLSRIKKCENPECTLHFYDTSKNRSRRWCSMAACGNVMKARAHYRRHRRQKTRS
ncbi:MAG: hypothetical protein AVDCRST_MAG12-726 [uncultured Rubrobacteraceae bacterium]|uniref:Zinc finger CGNR domain-containing protein n=1 Tax=uncultured Rubrobacteraceae bacterium TaxID=349277 RepID=A0A6J4RCN9_9ACTN|nr:MAG: hypothetical protein AVDCRST_MAG12-726 [uncultured Rubrobacteraceae bacterium]